MKKALFVATFAVGVIVGVVAPHILIRTPTTDEWIDSEEEILKRMGNFQKRLDLLAKSRPDSVEALSKQTEAQRGIEDILTKYRKAKQAKFAPYIGAGGTFAAAMITGIVTWLVARRKQK